MEGYGPSTYGDRWAEVYDELVQPPNDTEATVDLLAAVAGRGPVLELGIGTGRLALPLARRGIEVRGIDASEAMVRRLREKPGSDAISVTIGDFADVGVEGRFSMVFVAFNTIFALPSQEDQIRCFANVAAHLEEGGRFVVSAFVPDLSRFDRGQRIEAVRVDADAVQLCASRHDAVQQLVASQHVVVGSNGIKLYPTQIRYAWPPELDLMARLAGLELRDRWGGWRREPFDSTSTSHVSVYERPEERRGL